MSNGEKPPVRVLMVLPWIPWPLRTGGKVRVFNVCKALANRSDVQLTVIAPVSKDDAEGVYELQTLGVEVHGLSGREGRRSLGRHLFGLFSRRPSSMVDRRDDVIETVQALWDSGQFDLIQVEFLAMSYAIPGEELRAQSLITLHFPAALTLRRNLGVLPRLRPIWIYTAIDAAKSSRFERNVVQEFRCSFVTSEHDARLLSGTAGGDLIVAPNAVDENFFDFVEDLSAEPIVVSTCNFENPINTAGVVEFIREVWPLVIAREPQARYEVIGRNPPTSIVEAARTSLNVTVLGEVEDVRPHFARARASIVMMRAGGGTKLRFLTSLSMGIPVISTELGAEGLSVQDLDAVQVVDGHLELAHSVLRCMDDGFPRSARQALREFVLREHTWTETADRMVLQYRRILESDLLN